MRPANRPTKALLAWANTACAQPAAWAGILSAFGFLLFALPGATVQAYGFTDLFTFWDWINAMNQGRLPGVDLHSPVGLLCYFIPWLGSQLAGQTAGAIGTAGALVAAFLLALTCAAWRCGRGGGLALFMLAVFGLCAVPWNPGDGWLMATQIGFYNRWGSTALAVLMLLGTGEPDESRWRIDAIVATLALLFLFFLKLPHFLVAAAFVLGFGLALRRFAKAARLALACFAGVTLAVQLSSGMVSGYAMDAFSALQATGLVWPIMLRQTAADAWLFLLLSAAACCLAPMRQSATRLWPLFLFGAAGSFALAAHSAMTTASLVILLPAIVQAMRLNGSSPREPKPAWLRRLRSLWAMRCLMAPFLIGQAVAATMVVNITRLGGDAWGRAIRVDMPPLGLVHTYDEGHAAYARTLRDGTLLLRSLDAPCRTVATLDFAQPFAALLSLRPSRSFLWVVHVGRSVSRRSAPDGAGLFYDVECVMRPKQPHEPISTQFLLDTYGSYMDGAFRVVAETDAWVLLRRNPAAANPT